ncbi:hypothetical protein MTBBW1_760003 [Desulfamplus magnetovallimortis]|uniref:Uncharacterized protein n=1 Tax=Desulfamplus magnetovallimortis TaxID=1246637 RepID=A0A1W1HJ88_9BACT|nr:hypothetical protein [Desulfamplus magnetovallimortis]SLM32539.1 hypothetical protein MTBBW1_760003 [Desulfamplus magnetovallimortis]
MKDAKYLYFKINIFTPSIVADIRHLRHIAISILSPAKATIAFANLYLKIINLKQMLYLFKSLVINSGHPNSDSINKAQKIIGIDF